MQNTPPVARGGLLWAVRADFRLRIQPGRFWAALARRCELVKPRGRHRPWTVEELQAVTADIPAVLAQDPEIPNPVRLRQQARRLQQLGIPFSRMAELLGVREEQLAHAAPVVPDRQLWLPSLGTTRVRRLREEDWS